VNEILSAVIPIFLVAASAYLVRHWIPLHTKTLSSLNLYLLVPALVFNSLSQREIHWAVFGRIALGCVLMLGGMTVTLSLIARWRGIAQKERGAFLMTLFPNLGNFGLPVCLFAFGQEGLAYAVVVLVCGSFLQNSVGIYFAQRARHGVGKAFRRVFEFPMIYAFLLALVFQRWGYHLPIAIDRAVKLIADASIPIQLIILGMQLAETRLEVSANVFLAAAIRLLGGPALAAVIVFIIGLNGLAGNVFITQMSGPVAVGMAAYAVQFDLAPRFLASAVSWTFLFSIATVSLVLFVLKAMSF